MSTTPAAPLHPLPTLGAPFAGGKFAGITTNAAGEHFAFALLPDLPPGRMNWHDAMAWAQSVGGDLPTKAESAVLFETLKGEFEPRWHWTSTQYSANDAYYQVFDNGSQHGSAKSWSGGSARAVRRLPINPSVL